MATLSASRTGTRFAHHEFAARVASLGHQRCHLALQVPAAAQLLLQRCCECVALRRLAGHISAQLILYEAAWVGYGWMADTWLDASPLWGLLRATWMCSLHAERHVARCWRGRTMRRLVRRAQYTPCRAVLQGSPCAQATHQVGRDVRSNCGHEPRERPLISLDLLLPLVLLSHHFVHVAVKLLRAQAGGGVWRRSVASMGAQQCCTSVATLGLCLQQAAVVAAGVAAGCRRHCSTQEHSLAGVMGA
jgi:hypothetical protein